MSPSFDPYYKWLAIPAKDQPPNHYRLLALDAFEADRDVIATAADQRMMLVRSFQSGESYRVSQQILNELSAAKLCLLDPARKKEYDRTLRQQLAGGPRPMAAPPRPGTAPATAPPAATVRRAPFEARKPVRRDWLIPAAVSGVALLVVVVAAILLSRTAGPDNPDKHPAIVGQLTKPETPPASGRPDSGTDTGITTGAQVKPPAEPLQFQPVGPQKVAAGTKLKVPVRLTENSASVGGVRYTLAPNAPSGVEVDPTGGTVSWALPAEQAAGPYTIGVVATAGERRGELSMVVSVEAAGKPPRIKPISQQSAEVGVPLRVRIEAGGESPSAQPLRYRLVSGPPQATLNPQSGEFLWKPRPEDNGHTFEVRVGVANAAGRETESMFAVRVGSQVVSGSTTGPPPMGSGISPPRDARLPVPPVEARTQAAKQIHQLYAQLYAKARMDRAGKLALIEKLMADAETTTDDAAGRYALYREAADLAHASVRPELYMRAIDAIAKHYAIDGLEEKQQGLVELSRSVRGDESQELARALLSTLEDAVAADAWESAVTLSRAANTVAAKSRDPDLRKLATQRGHDVANLKKLYAEKVLAAARLAEKPDDPEGNRTVGSYVALVKAHWSEGLPLLAKGDDAAIAAAANAEHKGSSGGAPSVAPPEQPLCVLDREYQFYNNAILTYADAPNIKWIRGKKQNSFGNYFYVITSVGELRSWANGANSNLGPVIAIVGTEVYATPSLLVGAYANAPDKDCSKASGGGSAVNVANPAAAKEIGDAWWAVLKEESAAGPTRKLLDTTSVAKDNVRRHTLAFYEASLAGLNGLVKKTVEQRIAQLKQADAEAKAIDSPRRLAGLLVHNRWAILWSDRGIYRDLTFNQDGTWSAQYVGHSAVSGQWKTEGDTVVTTHGSIVHIYHLVGNAIMVEGFSANPSKGQKPSFVGRVQKQ